MARMTQEMETALVGLANRSTYKGNGDFYIDDYQKVFFYVYSHSVLEDILRVCKFHDMGNVYDYPDVLPQPDSIDGFDLTANFELFQKLAISKKLNSLVMYTNEDRCINCTFLIDIGNLKKFAKLIKGILQQDSRANLFREVDFRCEGREYIEVSDATGDNMKPADVLKKKVDKESLIFDDKSTIVEVMNDIFTFFKEGTVDLYNKMQIAYKRGIILHGDPGNGKSSAIREIIRTIDNVSKIVINPNVTNVTRILSSLVKSLEGKKAIIIIEDIDSLITDRNRSEFLNILDGVDIKSGLYFIGTTNYPEQIDSAFMNRPGRFDRTYKIDNPSESTRRMFFKSRDIGELLSEYKVHRDNNIPDSDEGIIELFVKNSDGLPMASLKEIMRGTLYLLASKEESTVEAAAERTYATIINIRTDHVESHNNFKSKKSHKREMFLKSLDADD